MCQEAGHHSDGAKKNPPPSCSIREFCDLSIPIIMFDKNSDYLVLRLEEVSPRRALAGKADWQAYTVHTAPAALLRARGTAHPGGPVGVVCRSSNTPDEYL